MYDFNELMKADPEIAEAVKNELNRQRDHIELIASENFVSKAVMAAAGSWLTNKYAEGTPGKRYYHGCEYVDVVENAAKERAKKLFGAGHANVQPHSGAQANEVVYYCSLDHGDTIMGMNLAHGGHLSHGSPVNLSGRYYNIVPYGVGRETGTIDYDEMERLAREHKPKLIVAGASSYPRAIDFKRFGKIAEEVGAYFMADMAHIGGLVAAGLHESPVPYAHFVTSTTHKTLRGPRGGFVLCREELSLQLDKAVFPGTQGGPLMHAIAAKAVAFGEALTDDFKQYSKQIIINAKRLAEALKANGFDLVSGGTDNHLILVDLRNMGITGKEAAKRLEETRVTCNKNVIPFDPQTPFVTSGIRLGTPAVTTRGMKEDDMDEIAEIITMVIKDYDRNKDAATERVKKLSGKYPLY